MFISSESEACSQRVAASAAWSVESPGPAHRSPGCCCCLLLLRFASYCFTGHCWRHCLRCLTGHLLSGRSCCCHRLLPRRFRRSSWQRRSCCCEGRPHETESNRTGSGHSIGRFTAEASCCYRQPCLFDLQAWCLVSSLVMEDFIIDHLNRHPLLRFHWKLL